MFVDQPKPGCGVRGHATALAQAPDALAPVAHVYDVDLSTARWQYTLGQPTTDLVLVLVLGLVYRAAAFALMVTINKRRQK